MKGWFGLCNRIETILRTPESGEGNHAGIMFQDYPDMMTVFQLQKVLGVGRNTAYNLIRDNKVKSVRIGRTIRIPKQWLIEYIENEWCNNARNGRVSNGGAT